MSDTNRVALAFQRQTQEAFPITGAQVLEFLRITGTPNLAFTPQTIVSEEIRQDRQRTDLISVGAEAGGDTGVEMSSNAIDDFFESGVFGTWDDTANTVPTITVNGEINAAAGEGDRFQVGSVVRLVNATGVPLSSGDPGEAIYVVTLITVDALTVVPFDSNTNATLATDVVAAGTTLTITGFRAVAATELVTSSPGSGSGQIVTLTASGASGFVDLRNAEAGSESNLVPGHWIKLAGFDTDLEKNVYARILTIDATTITFAQDGAVDFSVGEDGSAMGEQLAIFFGDVLINPTAANIASVEDRQFALERSFTDHSPISREVFLGMSVNVLDLNLSPQAIFVGSVTFFGLDAKARDDSLITELYAAGQPTRNEAPQHDVFNTSSNIGRIGRGADRVGQDGVNCVLEATVNLNNNLRRLPAVGVFGACAIGVGELAVCGNLGTYFDDLTLYQDVLDGNETTLDFVARDNGGRAILIDLPRIKFNGGAPQVPGKNQDVTLPLTYDALLESVLGYTILFQRFAAAI